MLYPRIAVVGGGGGVTDSEPWETITTIFSRARYLFIFFPPKIKINYLASFCPKSIKFGKWTTIGEGWDIVEQG